MSSSRETFQKRTKRGDQRNDPTTYDNFSRGMIRNAPHDDLPEKSLANLINAHAYPTEIQPRLGARWINFTVPPIEGRTGYTASKAGNVITATAEIFSQGDVSNYFVFPGTDIHQELTGYISTTQMRARDVGDIDLISGCWMHGRQNLFEFHYAERKVVMQWGQVVYVSQIIQDSTGKVTLDTLVKAPCVSFHQPGNVVSDWSEMDQYGVIYNSNGTFLLDFSTSPPLLFKKNSQEPRVLPADVERTTDSKFRYDILYTMSRLAEQGIRTRTTESAEILQESAPTALNEDLDPPRDNAITWTTRRIDSGDRTNGRLTGGRLAPAQQTPNYWVGLNDATLTLVINDQSEMFVFDFSIATGAAVTSLEEVAAEIQRVVRLVFYSATCEYQSENFRFVLTSGEEDGSVMDYADEGVGGTPVANLMLLVEGDATLDNVNIYAQPRSDGYYTVPLATPANPEWHWTHYVKYRTTDIGPSGVTPRIGPSGEILPPLRFTYAVEVRTCGAFYAERASNGIVTAFRGTFQIYDVGTALEWLDGEIDTIYRFIDDTHVSVAKSGESNYYMQPKKKMVCAIGGGEVVEASQSGDLVTRTGGPSFTEADLRKPIFWSTDYSSIISEYIDGDTVRVYDSIDRETQGLTYDPIRRMINDPMSDEGLRNRQGETSIGLLTNRFWTAMPNVNIGEVVPGFMVTAIRNFTEVYYCQLGAGLKYLSGYFLSSRQTSDKVENSIQTIKMMPNKVIVFCKGATWGGPTNQPRVFTLPEFGEHFAVLYFDVIDIDVGVIDIASIRKIDSGFFEMRCSDGSVRQFNSHQYFEDLTVDPQTSQDRIKKDFQECWQMGTSCYIDRLGHVFWTRTRNG